MEVALGVILVGVALLLIIDFLTAPKPKPKEEPTLNTRNDRD